MVSYYKITCRYNVSKTRILYYFIVINLIIFCFCLINTRSRLMYVSKKAKPEYIPKNPKITPKSSDSSLASIDSTKYILLWTNPKHFPFSYFGEGNGVFVNKTCKSRNCYVTGDRNFLGSYTEFDVIAFNGPQLSSILYNKDFPKKRRSHQKYVYANIESAQNYPLHTESFEGFFNWTWTYKLNSDAVWGYFVVKDVNDNVIGPRQRMHWMSVETMAPIDSILKNRLRSKKKAAVWFASNCFTMSRREEYVALLQKHLKEYYMDVDIYGECGPSQCPKQIMQHCLNMVQREYYFYLAFENALSDDYVTEKIVYALNYDAIPVVYGGANYSRFMPEGIYLDAMKLKPKALAKKMYEIIQEPERYHKFFRWKKYYSFHFKHESPDTDDYCKFCAIVNNDTLLRSYSAYENFSSWWMDKGKPPMVSNFEDLTSV